MATVVRQGQAGSESGTCESAMNQFLLLKLGG